MKASAKHFGLAVGS